MKRTLWTLVAAILAVGILSASALAADKPAKKTSSTVVGTLALAKETDGKVSGATITTKSGTVYKLSGLAQNVAALDGKEVSAKGEVKDDAGVVTLLLKGHITAVGEPKEKTEKKPRKAKK